MRVRWRSRTSPHIACSGSAWTTLTFIARPGWIPMFRSRTRSERSPISSGPATCDSPGYRPHAVGFLFEGVVVGHFPGHAGVAGDETECGKTTEDSQSENRINRGMGDMNTPQPATQRMGQHDYKVFLFHSLSGRTPFWIRGKGFPRGPGGAIPYKNFILANSKL